MAFIGLEAGRNSYICIIYHLRCELTKRKYMQTRYRDLFFTIAVAVALFLATSCSRDSDDPFADNRFLTSAEKVFTTPTANILTLLNMFSSANPDVAALSSYVTHDVDVWRVTYKTTLYNEEITASGLICFPATPGNYPVLSFQNGTNTQHSNAPSVYPANFSYLLVQNVASMGFVVVIPDYPGFGSSDNKAHPYLLKEPTVRCVKDMLEALREFDADIALAGTTTDDLYLFGYSQGGWATLALHSDIETNGVAGFNLVASAAGAGPASLSGMFKGLVTATEYPMPSYFAYIAHAYHTYNQFAVGYADIFNQPFASRIPSLFNGMLSTGSINAQLTAIVADLLKPEFIAGFDTDPFYGGVWGALEENSIGAWNTSVPLFLTHGEDDTQVPAAVTVSFYNDMITAGSLPSVVSMELIPGADHGNGLIPASVKSLLFLIELTGKR
jgi:pimeloyl-ACP methyl ester carboxylesterase